MKIGIIGCAGRMGRTLVKDVYLHEGCELSGGTERSGSEYIGQTIGTLIGVETPNIFITDDTEALVTQSDAVIDFTTPENTLALAALTAKHKKAHIIGTTGLDESQHKALASFAEQTAIVHSHNMSVGVNILLDLVEKTAARLEADSCDIEIVEMHHRYKVDAPSGTALALGEAAAKGRNVALSDVACYAREGHTGARPTGEIGFATLRGGGVIGDHTVIFAGEDERIEITHKAGDRSIFAHGAVRAALWTKGQKPGLYSMKDVLGL